MHQTQIHSPTNFDLYGVIWLFILRTSTGDNATLWRRFLKAFSYASRADVRLIIHLALFAACGWPLGAAILPEKRLPYGKHTRTNNMYSRTT